MSESIQATTEEDVASAIRDAALAKAPVEIRGGGTRLGLGRPVQAAKTLAVDELRGVTLYEPGALTIVAKAGTPLSELDAALAAENQRLPFEPMDHRSLLGSSGDPTIGGVVAAGVSGPRRLLAGACRDSVIGVRFIDGHGTLVKNGGRVMKNVTGYDLSKFMTGAFGTLGVLTEISLKVLPMPETSATLAFHGLNAASAVALMADAVGSPFEISGAAHVPGAAGASQTLLRIEGFETQVSYRLGQLRERLAGGQDADILRGVESDAIWTSIRDVTAFAGDGRAVWDISVRPSDGPGIVETVSRERDAAAIFDWAGGRIWLAVDAGGDAGAALIRTAVAQAGGHATLVRGSASLKASVDVFQPEHPRLAELARAMRAKFDPSGILNPGRLAA